MLTCACSICLGAPRIDPLNHVTQAPAVTLADRLHRLGVATASEAIDLLEQRLSAATGRLDNRVETV